MSHEKPTFSSEPRPIGYSATNDEVLAPQTIPDADFDTLKPETEERESVDKYDISPVAVDDLSVGDLEVPPMPIIDDSEPRIEPKPGEIGYDPRPKPPQTLN